MSYNSLLGLGNNSEPATVELLLALNETTGTTADDASSNARDGTYARDASLTTASGLAPWSAAAYDPVTASNDKISLASRFDVTDTAWTISWWWNTPTTSDFVCGAQDATNQTIMQCFPNATTLRVKRVGTNYDFNTAIASGVHHYAVTLSGTTLSVYRDGAFINSTTITHSQSNDAGFHYFSANHVGTPSSNIPQDEIAIWSEALDSSEVAEIYAGPEPVNTVAPALSGTELVGETLTATSGTWALDAPFSGGSNGTVTYSYQWTRSDDDSGTNEADISGATSSTYVLTSSDAGKYVRCRVRGTNDGGFDADADTNTAMSGKIATTALLANLAAHFKKDETSGTVVIDSSGNGNHGTYVNSPTLGVPAPTGRGVAYNGTNQYATCPTETIADYPVTIACWYYSNGIRGTDKILLWHEDANNFLEIDRLITTQYIRVAARFGGGTVRNYDTTTAIVDGWQHIAVVFESATAVTVYVDGVLVANGTGLASVSAPASATLHMLTNIATNTAYSGSLDDIRLYSRALSPTEAKALWLTGYPYRRSSIVQPIVRRPVQPILQ